MLLSAAISIAGAYAYIRDTFAGKTKPNRVSWSMWALAPLVGVIAASSSDADFWASIRIFLAGFLPLLVFVASYANPQSYWKLTPFDLLCGVFSVVALVVWAGVDSPRIAILIAVLGDACACIPTVIKAWKFPQTETGATYIASFVSAVLVLPSIPQWNIENSAFQIYLLVANTFLMFSVYRKRIKIRF